MCVNWGFMNALRGSGGGFRFWEQGAVRFLLLVSVLIIGAQFV